MSAKPNPPKVTPKQTMIKTIVAGQTQQALTERLNRQQPYVAKLEHADHRMDVADLAAIAAALAIPVGDLATRLLSPERDE